MTQRKPVRAGAKKQKPAKPSTAKAKANVKAKAKAKAKARPKKATAKRATAANDTGSDVVQEIIQRAFEARDQGSFAVGATLFEHAAVLSPSDWRLPNEAGVLYFRAEHYADAVRCFDAALRLRPGDLFVLFNKALAHSLASDDDAALAVLRDVLAVDSTYGPAHFEIGKIYQRQDRLADAYACFATALAANPSAPPPPRLVALALLNQARIRFEQNRDADALAHVRALWDAVQDGPTIVKLARELSAAGQHERARAVIDVLLAVDPGDADAVAIARVYRQNS
ncbi:MAG TPA: tetratricopeptide repeat protein [Kofleriaceae bacterium]|nr:tetratricopeptide repeat protein [Kofleriaceae bacterium]